MSEASVHICRGVNRAFISQTRMTGHRKWTTVCRASDDYDKAVMSMAAAFCSSGAKRGRVLMTADYYDPVVIVEMHR